MTDSLKPLDFVKLNGKNAVGMIAEVSEHGNASVRWFRGASVNMVAWFHPEDLTVIDNLPSLLAHSLAHPFGTNSLQPFAKAERRKL